MTSLQWLWIQPLDVLFFRDSKPFNAGEGFRAKSAFPPTPYPFVGALRARILADTLPRMGLSLEDYRRHISGEAHGAQAPDPSLDASKEQSLHELVAQIGDASSYGRLRFWGPLLAQDMGRELYFPAPLDLFSSNRLVPLEKHPKGMETNRPADTELPRLLWSRQALGNPLKEPFVDSEALAAYLRGDRPNLTDNPLVDREPRVGIAMDTGRRTVKEGLFYISEMLRIGEAIGFVMGVEGYELDQLSSGLLQLGGEGRGAYFHVLDSLKPVEKLRKLSADGDGRFKLYLASPAIFKQGWLPDFVDPKTLVGTVGATKVKLVAAAVGKPLSIGGWDLAKRAPKTMYKAVPPGSVYFFEVEEGETEAVCEAFHFTCYLQAQATADLKQLANIGFGLSLVGQWNYAAKEVTGHV